MKKYSEYVRLSPNRGGEIVPKFIVLHHSAGSFAGSLDWISKSESRVSYHYLIRSDGGRVQMVWDSVRAWACGESSWKGFYGLNSHSVSISFWGDTSTRLLGFEEFDSCAEKCIYLMEKFGLEIDAIITHQMIAPDRKNDCSVQAHSLVIERICERLEKKYEKC